MLESNVSRENGSPITGWKTMEGGKDYVSQSNQDVKDALRDLRVTFSECPFYTGDLQNPSNDLLKLSEESYQSDMLGRFNDSSNDVSTERTTNGLKQRRGRIWGPEWGLVPWSGMRSNSGSKSDNRGVDTCKRKLSPGKWNSVFLTNSRKTFDFQHSSDFKEYIRQYREGHTQAVLIKEQDSSLSSSKQSERIPVPSSRVEGTDLTTLVPKPDHQTHKIPKHNESTETSEQAETGPTLATELKTYLNNNKTGVPGERYGCSKGMAVYRKGVNLSPIRKSASPELKFDITAAMDLARQGETRRNTHQSKYLNLKNYKIDKFVHKHVKIIQPEKKGKIIEYGERNNVHLRRPPIFRRASLTHINSVKVIGLQTTWKSSIQPKEPRLEATEKTSTGISQEVFKMVPTSSGIRFPATTQHDKPGSLYLGYCLSQLSTPNSTLPGKDEHKFAAYQLHGRQLRGDIFSPRAFRGRSPSHDAIEADQSPPLPTNPYNVDIPDKIDLGIKGNTLQSQLQRSERGTASLGIFDMPV